MGQKRMREQSERGRKEGQRTGKEEDDPEETDEAARHPDPGDARAKLVQVARGGEDCDSEEGKSAAARLPSVDNTRLQQVEENGDVPVSQAAMKPTIIEKPKVSERRRFEGSSAATLQARGPIETL